MGGNEGDTRHLSSGCGSTPGRQAALVECRLSLDRSDSARGSNSVHSNPDGRKLNDPIKVVMISIGEREQASPFLELVSLLSSRAIVGALSLPRR